jgi:hypothetical protein
MRDAQLATLRHDEGALRAMLVRAGVTTWKGRSCCCPWHEDHHPSAGIFQGEDGSWRYKCLVCGVAGDIFDIQARVEGRSLAEVLSGSDGGNGKAKPPPKQYSSVQDIEKAYRGHEATYVYVDENGEPRMYVFRFRKDDGSKGFLQARPSQGKIECRAPEKPWPLYCLPEILKAEICWVVEGEKCVEAVREYGLCCTTSPGGAKNGQNADWSPLSGKDVVVWPDSDAEGLAHGQNVVSMVSKIHPKSLRLVDPKSLGLDGKQDVVDWLQSMVATGWGHADVLGGFQLIVEEAQEIPVGPASILSCRIEAIISGELSSVPWPWSQLDELAPVLTPGGIVVFAGTPGAAKSFAMLQCIAFWADKGYRAEIGRAHV